MDSSSTTNDALEDRIRQQSVVANLGQQALETDDLDQLMHDASVAVAETLDNEYCKVLELLPGGEEVLLRQGVGWQDGLVGSATVPTDLDSQAGYTLASEKPVIVDDLREEERFTGPDLLIDHDVTSGISVVIGSVEDPWGVLGTHTTQRRGFTEHDATFVQSVANVLASAIEHLQARQDLERSEERFRSMMEQSPFSVQIFDEDGRTIAANPAWERLWDASRDELGDYNILEDEQLEAAGLLPAIRDAFRGEVVTLPVTHYDPGEIGKPGRDRWIEGYAYPLLPGEGESFEVVLVHHDVTDRNERERELERVRDRMEFALSATDAVVWDWDVEADEASFYPDAESLYGTTVEDWEDFVEVIHPDDRTKVQRGIEESLETGEPKYEEIRIVRDGEVRWIEAPGQPVSKDDEPTRMIGVARDITERKQNERRLQESNERLEQFAHAASHDLQEPLRMVSSYLQLIEQRYADELDEDAEEFIEFAVDGADRMREMIQSLLSYSRIETRGQPFERVDLDDVLDAVLTDLEVRIEESDAEITTDSLPRVEGDPDQLRELLQNLLTNAIEYCGDESPIVDVTTERDGTHWVVSVSDEGIGIDPADHESIFEVFERLHTHDEHPGTGIGLALCDRIVERHGGDLWVESERGDGATFRFTLPSVQDE